MSSLRNSIEGFYEAFADIPKPKTIDTCPCCVDNEGICTLLSRPLRGISGDQLSSYASSAFLTVGDIPDYLYFLPRILEVSISDESWWPDPEVTGRAISNTKPLEWPEGRVGALKQLLASLFHSLLSREDTGYLLDSWLCAIGKMGLDVIPFLKQIEESQEHVLSYYEMNAKDLMDKQLSNSFWDAFGNGYDKIVDWFGSEKVGGMKWPHKTEPKDC